MTFSLTVQGEQLCYEKDVIKQNEVKDGKIITKITSIITGCNNNMRFHAVKESITVDLGMTVKEFEPKVKTYPKQYCECPLPQK